MINPDIFREYDIRGIADRDLTAPVIEALGRAFASYISAKGITSATIGYDARLSSVRLSQNFTKGLTDSGISVTNVGLCPTPVLYFSLFHLKPGAGVMITGSHNPPEFNGFKLCVGADTIHGEEIQKLRKIMEEQQGKTPASRTAAASSNYEILPHYIQHLQGLFKNTPGPKLKVVLDSGNGTGGLAAPDIIKTMGCEVVELYSKPDGTFPNHHPDPTIPKNLAALIDTVKKERADIGIGFDGDSDRIGVVDELGNILWGDQLMILFARDILRVKPGATFVSEVKCSQVMYDDIRAHGGNAIMWKAGHSLIKAKLKELHGELGGEMSGHIFFADRYFGYDDAIYAACRIIEILKKTKQEKPGAQLSSLLAGLPKTFNTPEIRFDCPEHIKFKVVERARELYSDGTRLPRKPKEVITVDGVRAIFDDGWGLIRASNTQPVLVMRFEAVSESALERIKGEMEREVGAIVANMLH
jgi:phosphomannomutase/phosphoglucomutase